MTPVVTRFGPRLLVIVGLMLALAVPPLPAQSARGHRSAVAVPDRTDAGNWDGTWFYVNRAIRMAIWLKTEDGVPKLKVRFLRLGVNENFVTDWNGQAEYYLRQSEGTFSLATTSADANTITADLEWNLKVRGGRREETAKITLYRIGEGRRMVLKFDDHEGFLYAGSRPTALPQQVAWTFRKASKRLVLWEVLPF